MVYQCKMCGGNLDIKKGDTICTCQYCDAQQTLPKLKDEKRMALYERASHFRRNNEYDKAMGIYEIILGEDNTDSEAYWSLILCKYGVEYVEDPITHKRNLTCNRTVPQSVLADEDYKAAIRYADASAKKLYEEEASTLEQIQKSILEISSKEEPYDIFICYKESDEQGKRTRDSVIAQEIYQELSEEGYRVFFSRVSLEGKIGTEYEPYIYAALSSAQIMIVVGTRKEFFNAVWVKNEWSRFLGMTKTDSSKVLIPAYRDMDAYDLPDELLHLQAQDTGKLGFMQDLSRGIGKIMSKKDDSDRKNGTGNVSAGVDIDNLIKRIYSFLEEGDRKKAEAYCEKVLDIKIDEPEVYIAKLIMELSGAGRHIIRSKEELLNYIDSAYYDNIERTVLFQKASEYADDKCQKYLKELRSRNREFCYDSIQKGYDGQEKNYALMTGIIRQFIGGEDDARWKKLSKVVELRYELKTAQNNQMQLSAQLEKSRKELEEAENKLKKLKRTEKRLILSVACVVPFGVLLGLTGKEIFVTI